jgi:uncharacterized protein
MKTIKGFLEFEWDKGNKDKNWKLHHVKNEEAEETFFDDKKKILKDNLHSGSENRYILLGATKKNKILFIVFTIRNKKIRIISSRNINKKEIHLYEKKS